MIASDIAVPPQARHASSWLQVLSHLSPQYGGIATSVPSLARATEAQGGVDCPIVGFCAPEELDHVDPRERRKLKVFAPDRARWIADLRLRDQLKKTIQASAGIHIHGIWEMHCVTSAGIARSCKRPYLISAHGMLEPWALRQKRLKKALYAALIEHRVLRRATCLRALTTDEAQDYRRVGLSNPIAVVPSGIEVPMRVDPKAFFENYPHLFGKQIVLFMGRLHYKKGLHLLLRAWAKSARHTDAHLVIAGPDSDGTLATLAEMQHNLNLRDSVTFAGMVAGDRKWSMMSAASLFVLPSYSEGFSIAVLEALGMGLPVMVTPGCHISQVVAKGCGWVIQPEVEPLRRALEEFFELSPDEIAQAGRRGRDFVQRNYHWPVVGKQMTQVYDWLEGGSRPQGVEIV